MKKQNLKCCMVEGYERIYFRIGQVWETRDGSKLKVIGFDLEDEDYPIILSDLEDEDKTKLYYTQKGECWVGEQTPKDLVKLITENNENGLIELIINKNESEVPTESTPSETQLKILSEYLKENNAYESFVENSVTEVLESPQSFLNKKEKYKSKNYRGGIGDFFIWMYSPQGEDYWIKLVENKPNDLIYDMDEIVFAEVEKRLKLKAISENPNDFLTKDEIEALPTLPKQKEQPKQEFLVYVHGKNAPKHIHDSYGSAEKEAKRLAEKEIGCNVSIVSVVKTFKSKVIVEEV